MIISNIFINILTRLMAAVTFGSNKEVGLNNIHPGITHMLLLTFEEQYLILSNLFLLIRNVSNFSLSYDLAARVLIQKFSNTDKY